MGPYVRLSTRARQSLLAAVAVVPLLSFSVYPVSAQASIETADDGVVSIGGQVVMRLRASAGGMSTEQRVDAIEDRLTRIVAVPDIKVSDVIVYTSEGKPPVIYVLGRRLITVDSATVKSAGGGSARQLATLWAKRLQQILPRVDIRLPDEPEPEVPAHPPLKITNDLSQVEGDVGDVTLRGKTVLRFRGVQPGGVTAAERADMLSDRLSHLADKLDTTAPDAVSVAPVDQTVASEAAPAATETAQTVVTDTGKSAPADANAPVQLLMGGKLVYTVTMADTKAAGGGSPQSLAESWAKNIRVALGMPPNGVPPAPPTPLPASPTVPNAPAGPPPPPTTSVLPQPPAPPSTPATPSSPATPGTPTSPNSPSTPGQPAAPPGTAAPATPPAPPSTAGPSTPSQPTMPPGTASPAAPSQPTTPPASTTPAPPAPSTPAQPPTPPVP